MNDDERPQNPPLRAWYVGVPPMSYVLVAPDEATAAALLRAELVRHQDPADIVPWTHDWPYDPLNWEEIDLTAPHVHATRDD